MVHRRAPVRPEAFRDSGALNDFFSPERGSICSTQLLVSVHCNIGVLQAPICGCAHGGCHCTLTSRAEAFKQQRVQSLGDWETKP